jgi:hypothetical protein
MARVLLIHPSRWGRGITAIWIPSHTAVLRAAGHEVELFDATFYAGWSVNEVAFNTANEQYRPTPYEQEIRFRSEDVVASLQATVDRFAPDVILWAALSSHIHGEGEYVNIQYGHQLVSKIRTRALRVAGGLQPTADPEAMFERFPATDCFIRGESELVLLELVAAALAGRELAPILATIRGIAFRGPDGRPVITPPQPIISDLDRIPPYDYSVFEDQAFLRPYNGALLRAVDYELSRGCIYACGYCVETVLQRYYGFDDTVPGRGTLRESRKYLRHKSAARAFGEIEALHRELGIVLFRCQDTNFLTIDRATLTDLAERMERADLPVMLYVETRPEGVNSASIELLRRLRVDGVGMGVELSTQSFREEKLGRFADQARIREAFARLRAAGIRRTAYNIIGLPEQDEASIQDTIRFNRELEPDNVTVAFYSPYAGTAQQIRGRELGYFDDYEYHVDGQLRSLSRHSRVEVRLLNFYKQHFNRLVRDGLADLDDLKAKEGLA